MSTTTETIDAQTTRWRIDPSRSSVEFHVRTFWGLSTVRGRFESYDGTLDMRSDPVIDLQIDADTLNTQNAMRDAHLRSVDFFDVENHPQVRFVSDSVTLDGERLGVRGRLHAAAESVPLEIDATLRWAAEGELELHAEATADQRKLGITYSPLGTVRSPSRLIVHGRLVPDA